MTHDFAIGVLRGQIAFAEETLRWLKTLPPADREPAREHYLETKIKRLDYTVNKLKGKHST